MNKTIKKVTVAAAVAAAMGMAAGAAQAITLSQYDTASLVPYVVYDSANSIDTAIGVTTMGVNTVTMSGAACNASTCGLVHWYFYNSRSCHEADGPIPVTSNDFAGFMWGDLARQAVTGGCTQAPLDGMKGYMILVSENGMATGSNPSLPIVSDAAMISGNWAAAAFIPTVPLNSGNWAYNGYYPNIVSSATSRMAVINQAAPLFADLDMRYFVGGLGNRTDLVIFVDKNHKASASDSDYIVDAFTYDENEIGNSTGVKINDELNVITLTSTSSPIGFVTTKKSGFITLGFKTDNVVSDEQTGSLANVDNVVAFSLIYTNTSGSAQTILAHERF